MHSLCYRLLGRPPIAETKVALWNEEHPAMAMDVTVKGSKDDAFAETTGGSWGTRVFAQISLARARMTPADLWTGEMQRFSAAWESWKEDNALIDFTDMIENVVRQELCHDDSVRVAFFDEVQDFSKLELKLARMWGAGMEYVVLVGDPDQAIFEWRGASARDFLEPEIPRERVRVLDQSYRIPATVHRLAVDWIEQCSFRYPTEYKPREEEGIVEHLQATSYQSPSRLADEIETCIEREEPCMVIMSCGYMLYPLIKELRERGVPFHNPYAQTNGRWNPLRAKGRLSSFLVSSKAAFGDNARMWTWEEMWSWIEITASRELLRHGAKKRIKAQAKDEHTRAMYPTPDVLEELFAMDPWLELCDALDSEERGADTEWLLAHTLSSRVKLLEYTSKVYQKLGVFALHSDPIVTIGTIHSVKGAEAHTVFVAPDLSKNGATQWNGEPEEKDSVIRVFYVAFTRARHRLVLLARGSAWGVRW